MEDHVDSPTYGVLWAVLLGLSISLIIGLHTFVWGPK